VIAHVAGIPLEELVLALTGCGAGLLAARAWIALRLPSQSSRNAIDRDRPQ